MRTKTGHGFGTPEESITPVKKERMIASAFHYRQTHNDLPESWRINVVAVELNQKGEVSRIELIVNTVEG